MVARVLGCLGRSGVVGIAKSDRPGSIMQGFWTLDGVWEIIEVESAMARRSGRPKTESKNMIGGMRADL